ALDELAQLRLGDHALELVDRLPADDTEHRRDRADLEMARELGLRIGVDFHEQEAAVVLLLESLEHRPERLARAAPRRPEIEHVGLDSFVRRLDHGWSAVLGGCRDRRATVIANRASCPRPGR